MRTPVRVALGLTLVPFVALGLARFAYGLLLPPMRADLGWSYGAAGGVTTANAIAVSAVTIPGLVEPASRWPLGWLLLAAVSAGCAVVLAGLLRDGDDAASMRADGRRGRPLRLWRVTTAYGLFGLGYIAYITFVVAHLRDGGATAQAVVVFWLLLGVASVASTQLWPRMLGARTDRAGLAMTLGGCTVAVVVVVASRSQPAAVVSGLLFGGSFLAVVSAATGLVRDALPERAWTGAIARLTVVFGVGQILGPILAGMLGDTPAGLRLGLAFSALMLGAATLIALPDRVVA